MSSVAMLLQEYVPPCEDYLGIRLERSLSKESLDSELSYFSTSTMTMTDNPGPGRVLDKYIFQRGGRLVERYIGRVAHAAGYGPAAVAQRIGNHLRGFSLELSGRRLPGIKEEDEPEHIKLRLDLGLVLDVDRLRENCRKLFLYTLSGSTLRKIQALRLIILLFIRFPYLRYYFDSTEITERLNSLRMKDYKQRRLQHTLEDALLSELSRMAYSCLLPGDATVARLIDHLAERMKYAEVHRRGHESTGPYSGYLPDASLIRNCCTNPETSFAAVRFTAVLFRHSFLTCGPTFFVKLNRFSARFWDAIVEVARYKVSSLSDLERIELFMLAVLEMLYCSISWDKNFEAGYIESNIVDSVLRLFVSPTNLLLPRASRLALSLSDRWEDAKCEYRTKQGGEKESLDSSSEPENVHAAHDMITNDDLKFDRKKCGPQCMLVSTLPAAGKCENCSQSLDFVTAQSEEDI